MSFLFSHIQHRPFLASLYREAAGCSNVPLQGTYKPTKQAVVLVTIAFQISTIFSGVFTKISKKGISISKNRSCQSHIAMRSIFLGRRKCRCRGCRQMEMQAFPLGSCFTQKKTPKILILKTFGGVFGVAKRI